MSDRNGCKDEKPVENGNEAKRLAVYGLNPDQLLQEPLVVPPGKHVYIDAEKEQKANGVVRLKPETIDDVKRWIGNPDELGAKRACCGDLPTAVPSANNIAEFRKLDGATKLGLRAIANEYVNGDSRRVAAFKSHLGLLLDRAYIPGIFLRQDIDIYGGAVLEVAASAKVLFARHIRIWRGGLLKIRGGVKIDCVSITGDLTFTFAGPILTSPALGYFVEMKEAANG